MSFVSVMRIYAEINIFCLALLALIQVRLYASINLTSAQRFMRNSIWAFILLILWDTIWAVLYTNAVGEPLSFENVFRSIYFIILIWAAYFWFLFDERLFAVDPDAGSDAGEGGNAEAGDDRGSHMDPESSSGAVSDNAREVSSGESAENAPGGETSQESASGQDPAAEAAAAAASGREQKRLEKKYRLENRKHILLGIPACIITAVNIVNIAAGHMFAIDVYDMSYFSGWTFLEYLFPAVYVLLAVFTTHRNFAKNSVNVPPVSLTFTRICLIGVCAAAVLQGVLNLTPLLSFLVTLAYLVCYITMQDESISVDALTHLNNRRQFTRYLEMKMHDRKPSDRHLYLMIMDLDYFKQINDTYGHVEGDAALIRMADAMRKCGEKYGRCMQISRYGGDEFIIVLETDRPEIADNIQNDVQKILTEKTEEAGVPYKMGVSIGTAEYSPEMKNVSEFLAAADARLYEVKMAHHSRRSAG